MMLVTGAIFAVLGPSQGAFQAQPEAADLQQRLRAAVDAISRDLVMAGAGTYAGPAAGSLGRFFAAVIPHRVGALSPDPPGTVRPDTLTVIYVAATASQTTVKLPVAPAAGVIEVNLAPGCPIAVDGCGFPPGATALIYDDTGAWDLFTIGDVGGTSIGRRAGSRPFSKSYAQGAHLVLVTAATYSVKNERGTQIPQLRRYDGDQTESPVVDDVVALTFEYFGDPEPPMLNAAEGEPGETTYGPRPPPIGVEDPSTGFPPGENCVFRVQDGLQVPRLPMLSSGSRSLVPLPGALLSDGPWCPNASSPNGFDADLLRIRQVRVSLRVQAGSAAFRGRDTRFFSRPGTATAAGRLVPDQQICFDILPRNLSLGR
jgi:hypothetical protein